MASSIRIGIAKAGCLMMSGFLLWWLCKRNPTVAFKEIEQGTTSTQPFTEEEISKFVGENWSAIGHQNSIKHFVKSFHRALIWSAVLILFIVFMLQFQNLIQYAILGQTSFEDAHATYHFEISNPVLPEEMMYLNIVLNSTQPSIMSHTTIFSRVVLYPNEVWRSNNNITALPEKYNVILSGTDCSHVVIPEFHLPDGTCVLPLFQDDFNNYRNNGYDFQYKSAGDFPILLATDDFFEANVTRTVGQYIVVSGYESSVANSYNFATIMLTILVAVIASVEIILSVRDRRMNEAKKKR